MSAALSPARALELVLPYPISANRYWATRVIKAKGTGKPMAITYVTPEADAYRKECAWRAGGAIKEPINGRVYVEVLLYPQRPQDWARRARKDPLNWDDDVRCIDLGNCEKVLSDALQGIVFTDDKWIWDMRKRRMEPDGDARVVVRITQLSKLQAPQLDLLEVAP